MNLNNVTFINPTDGTEVKWNDLSAEKKAAVNRALEHRRDIYDAFECIKSSEFKNELARRVFEEPKTVSTWRALFWDQDNIMVSIEHKPGVETSPKEIGRRLNGFCEMTDSKRRVRQLKTAVERGDYLMKRHHICGRCIVIVEILVKEV